MSISHGQVRTLNSREPLVIHHEQYFYSCRWSASGHHQPLRALLSTSMQDQRGRKEAPRTRPRPNRWTSALGKNCTTCPPLYCTVRRNFYGAAGGRGRQATGVVNLHAGWLFHCKTQEHQPGEQNTAGHKFIRLCWVEHILCSSGNFSRQNHLRHCFVKEFRTVVQRSINKEHTEVKSRSAQCQLALMRLRSVAVFKKTCLT